jgi:hypothetical protein
MPHKKLNENIDIKCNAHDALSTIIPMYEYYCKNHVRIPPYCDSFFHRRLSDRKHWLQNAYTICICVKVIYLWFIKELRMNNSLGNTISEAVYRRGTESTRTTYRILNATQLDLQLPVESMPITTKVVSSNPFHGEVYSMQRCVI